MRETITVNSACVFWENKDCQSSDRGTLFFPCDLSGKFAYTFSVKKNFKNRSKSKEIRTFISVFIVSFGGTHTISNYGGLRLSYFGFGETFSRRIDKTLGVNTTLGRKHRSYVM